MGHLLSDFRADRHAVEFVVLIDFDNFPDSLRVIPR
jgi:hypothetical protein